MQKTLSEKEKSMIKISEIRISCEEKKISLIYQFIKSEKDKNVFSVTMHRHQDNKNMS